MRSVKAVAEDIYDIDIRTKPVLYSREILRIICDNLGYHFGSILLVDELGIGSIFSSYNLPQTYPALVSKVSAPVLSSPSGEAIREKKPVVVNDIFSNERLKPWYSLLSQLKISTIVWIPLISKGRAFGTYNLYHDQGREVGTEELQMLNQIGMLFSMAIQSNEYIDEIREKTVELEHEILERKEVEAQLRLAKEQAEAANKAKSEFLSNVSHEIRTPMNAILGFSHILLEEENDAEKIENLEIILEAGKSLTLLIDDILQLSNLEADTLGLELIYFSLRGLLQQIYRDFADKADEKGIGFTLTVAPELPETVLGDPHKVNQVIVNIVKNAFKFTRQGLITINCNYSNNHAVIQVRDTGIGIPSDKKEAIFEAFNQVDTSATRKYEGTGLGLTIALRMTEKMGGRISMESELGEGSIFVVQLPLRAGQ